MHLFPFANTGSCHLCFIHYYVWELNLLLIYLCEYRALEGLVLLGQLTVIERHLSTSIKSISVSDRTRFQIYNLGCAPFMSLL